MGKKLAATAALIGVAVLGGVMAAAPANAAITDMGIQLSNNHNVVLCNDCNRIGNADQATSDDRIYSSNPNVTDGLETECWSGRS